MTMLMDIVSATAEEVQAHSHPRVEGEFRHDACESSPRTKWTSLIVKQMILSQGPFKGRKVYLLETGLSGSDQCLFLEILPPEIRNIIYANVLNPPDNTLHIKALRGGVRAERNRAQRSYRYYTTHDTGRAGILAACRQVHEEAAPIFYGSNMFIFHGTRVLSNFMTIIGSSARFLRTIKVHDWASASMPQALKLLGNATNLEALHFPSFTWTTPDWEYHYYRRDPLTDAQSVANIFKSCLQNLQKSRNDRHAVFDTLRFDDLEGMCDYCTGIGSRFPDRKCVCDSRPKAYIAWMELLRVKVFAYLEDAQEPIAKVENLIENADAVTKVATDEEPTEDDFAYLEPSPAAARRETGRPKRQAVTKKNISYAEA